MILVDKYYTTHLKIEPSKLMKEHDMEEERLTLTVEETAKLLGIGRNLCYDQIKTGEIPSLKIGRRLLVPRAALEKLLAEPKPLNLVPTSK